MNYVFNIASNCTVVNNFYNGGQSPLGGSEQPIPQPQPSGNIDARINSPVDGMGSVVGNETLAEGNSIADANGFMTVPPYHDLRPTVMPEIEPDIIPKPTRRGTRFSYLRNISDSPDYHFPPRELIEAEFDKGATSVLVKNGEEVEAEFDPLISYADGREKDVNYENQTSYNIDSEERAVDKPIRKRERRSNKRVEGTSKIENQVAQTEMVNRNAEMRAEIASRIQRINAEPKVDLKDQEVKTEQEIQDITPAVRNTLPMVNVVASTPSVEIIEPSVEKNNIPNRNDSPPIEDNRLETIAVEQTEAIPVETKPTETKPTETKPIETPSPQSDLKPEEPKGKLKLRDINSVKAVLDKVYDLWSVNLIEKLKADPSKAHLEELARKSMQKMIIENIINDLTDNVNLNSLEMSYNKVYSVLQNRKFPMERMISKEHFCYERID